MRRIIKVIVLQVYSKKMFATSNVAITKTSNAVNDLDVAWIFLICSFMQLNSIMNITKIPNASSAIFIYGK